MKCDISECQIIFEFNYKIFKSLTISIYKSLNIHCSFQYETLNKITIFRRHYKKTPKFN